MAHYVYITCKSCGARMLVGVNYAERTTTCQACFGPLTGKPQEEPAPAPVKKVTRKKTAPPVVVEETPEDAAE